MGLRNYFVSSSLLVLLRGGLLSYNPIGCCHTKRLEYHWLCLMTNIFPRTFPVIDVIALRHKFLRIFTM